MKQKVFFGIAIRIIVLFTIAIFATFLPEYLRPFFGDVVHVCDTAGIYCGGCNDIIDNGWEWGVRHYWYAWMMFILFLLALANVVISIINIIKKNYDTSKW